MGGGDRSLYTTVDEALGYLDARTEFWRQQKPMYARKRERELKKYRPAPTKPRSKGMPGASVDHTKHLLKALEDIDNGKTAHARTDYLCTCSSLCTYKCV